MKDADGVILFLMLAEALRRLPPDKRKIVITESDVHTAVKNRDTPCQIIKAMDPHFPYSNMYQCVLTNEPPVAERKKRSFNL